MPIEIHFKSESVGGEETAIGEIVIDDFRESFESPLDYWSRHDYERQWREGLDRTKKGASKSCLMTSMTDPKTANFLVWWVIHREGPTLFIQNQLVFVDQLEEPFNSTDPYRLIRDRRTVNDDGQRISEWVSNV